MVGYKKGLLRIAGIVFFVAALSTSLLVLGRNIESFAFFIASPNLNWGLFYIFSSLLVVAFFFFSIFSTGTAAIFAGTGGYVQSVWNCGIYSLSCISLFTTLQLITGITEGDEEIMMMSEISILLLLIYNGILFFSFYREENFSWKNLLASDKNTKLCLKVFALMMIVVEAGCFFYAHKVIE